MTIWIKMGWRNLWRNRRRSLIELTSIAGSIFFAVFMNNLAVGSYAKMVDDGVKMGSGHIGLYRDRYLELRKTELTMNADRLVSAIEKEPSVNAVYPRLHVFGLVRSSRDSRAAEILGLDFSREEDSNPIINKKNIIKGKLPSDNDSRGALIGEVLASELGLDVGKKFVIMAQGSDGQIASKLLKITGLFQTNARMIDAGMVIVPRKVLGNVIGKEGSAHEIAVMLHSHKMISKTLPRIREIARTHPDVDAYHWEKAMPDLSGAIQMDYVGFQIMVIFMYILVGIGTVNTLLMSVMERTREFGVIRAIGLNKAGIRKIVVSEAFVLAVTGVAAGMVLAVAACSYTSKKGIDYSFAFKDQGVAGTLIDPILYSSWDLKSMLILGVGMVFLALIASLYPAHHVLKIRPSDAMRTY